MLSEEDVADRKLPKKTTGVVITDINIDSPVSSLSVGDIIIEAQKKKIKSIDELKEIVDEIKNEKTTLLLVFYTAQNQRRYLGVKLN